MRARMGLYRPLPVCTMGGGASSRVHEEDYGGIINTGGASGSPLQARSDLSPSGSTVLKTVTFKKNLHQVCLCSAFTPLAIL